MVATGIEFLSYLDANKNDRERYSTIRFVTNTTNVTIPSNSTNVTNGSFGIIIQQSQSLNKKSNSLIGADYEMLENNTATFTVVLNKNGDVNWRLNGVLVNTTSGKTHNFVFYPGILFTDNNRIVNISANSGNSSASWEVGVFNVLNPFFSPETGSGGSTLHVFSNLGMYQNISATILNNNQLKSYNLIPQSFGNETDWQKQITNEEFGEGINYLVSLTVRKNNQVTSYNLSTEGDIRAFYKNTAPPPSGNGGSGGGSSGGSGGSSTGFSRANLVYVALGKDVVSINETQTVTLDARSSRSRVSNVEAVFLTPSGGHRREELSLIAGSNDYGTWEKEFGNFESGLYELISIDLIGPNRQATIITITDRSFYVVSEEVEETEKLALVYVVLSESRVDEAKNVTLKLDTRDSLGIERVDALIEKRFGGEIEEFAIPLRLSGGNKKYGTWEGEIEVDQGDTTYNVKSITLENLEDKKEYSISDRSVYASNSLPLPPSPRTNLITGGFAAFDFDNLKSPWFPTIMGFSLLIAIWIIIALHHKAKRRGKRTTNDN